MLRQGQVEIWLALLSSQVSLTLASGTTFVLMRSLAGTKAAKTLVIDFPRAPAFSPHPLCSRILSPSPPTHFFTSYSYSAPPRFLARRAQCPQRGILRNTCHRDFYKYKRE